MKIAITFWQQETNRKYKEKITKHKNLPGLMKTKGRQRIFTRKLRKRDRVLMPCEQLHRHVGTTVHTCPQMFTCH